DREQLRGDRPPGYLVGLGHDDDQRRVRCDRADLLADPPVPWADLLVGRDAKTDDVDLRVGVRHQVVQALPQQRARSVQAWGVDKDDLEVLSVHDAANRVPGGLRPVRRDGHFGADQRVGQRRLAGVRPADEADEAGPELAFAHARSRFGHCTVPARSVTMTVASADSSRTAATPESSAELPTSTAASRPVAPLDTAAATAACSAVSWRASSATGAPA